MRRSCSVSSRQPHRLIVLPLLLGKPAATDPHAVDLVPWAGAVQRFAAAARCLPGQAATDLAQRIEVGTLQAFKLKGPNEFADPGTSETVWWPAAELVARLRRLDPAVAARRFGGDIRGSPLQAWHAPPRGLGTPWPAPGAEPEQPPLIGPAGLATLLRKAACSAKGPMALPRGVLVALQERQLQALLDDLAPSAAVVQLRVVMPAHDTAPGPVTWTDDRLRNRLAELKAADHRAPTKQLAKESGLHERDIQRRMKALKDRARSNAAMLSAFPTRA